MYRREPQLGKTLRPAGRCGGKTVATLCICAAFALGADNAGSSPGSDEPAERDNRVKEFAPGVHINWQRRVVEVDAKVVLREGPLELLACSPRTREHESILAVQARPLHIFQAMGLIGLEPGSPARYDEKRDRWLDPVGELLKLRLRYREGNNLRDVPAERWLVDVKRNRPPEKVKWVFSGSRTFESGRFGADLDGTVVCVVDFDTALVSVGALHSADNELLWLVANTDAIPPIGTPLTLLISGARGKNVEVHITAEGSLRIGPAPVEPADVARAVKRGADDVTVVLLPAPGVSTEDVRTTVDSLVAAGVARASIKVERLDRQREGKTPPGKSRGG